MDKQTLVKYFLNLIQDSEVNISTRIDDDEFKLWPRTNEHQFVHDNFETLFDLFIKVGDRRVVLGTKQGSETFVGVLIYKINYNQDRIEQPTSITLHDRVLAGCIHNKRVELHDKSVHYAVEHVIDFIENKRSILP